jgi:hypothetical protein
MFKELRGDHIFLTFLFVHCPKFFSLVNCWIWISLGRWTCSCSLIHSVPVSLLTDLSNDRDLFVKTITDNCTSDEFSGYFTTSHCIDSPYFPNLRLGACCFFFWQIIMDQLLPVCMFHALYQTLFQNPIVASVRVYPAAHSPSRYRIFLAYGPTRRLIWDCLRTSNCT